MVGETLHKARLFAAIVGSSSKSRKGTSGASVKKLFTFDESSGYAQASCSPGPLSTGEGLVYAVRDEVLKWVVGMAWAVRQLEDEGQLLESFATRLDVILLGVKQAFSGQGYELQLQEHYPQATSFQELAAGLLREGKPLAQAA